VVAVVVVAVVIVVVVVVAVVVVAVAVLVAAAAVVVVEIVVKQQQKPSEFTKFQMPSTGKLSLWKVNQLDPLNFSNTFIYLLISTCFGHYVPIIRRETNCTNATSALVIPF
jgi:hypothetical protein